MFEDFITVEILTTFPGMVLVVALVTQFTKKIIDRLFKTHTEYVVYFYALALNFFVSYIKGFPDPWPITIVLNILNGIIVALAAMKAYETAISHVDYKSYVEKILKKKHQA